MTITGVSTSSTSSTSPTSTSNSVDRNKIKAVIDKYCTGGSSPLTPEMFINSSKKTGVPIDFYLVMAISESSMGTAGRAVGTCNPMNVGNVDSGANEHQSGWEGGLDRFGNLIKKEYFLASETPSLDKFIERDFKRPTDGARYMTNPETRTTIPKLTKEVREMLGLPAGTSLVATGAPTSTTSSSANSWLTDARDKFVQPSKIDNKSNPFSQAGKQN